ncbi:hypothetical protein Scep_012160 [Stephania cephalantha]|uniref:Uncharacterized protein n=1 Tax=Stephania cephalantha TaxID=152367 RepID=A0AAP0JGS0_9MAGN
MVHGSMSLRCSPSQRRGFESWEERSSDGPLGGSSLGGSASHKAGRVPQNKLRRYQEVLRAGRGRYKKEHLFVGLHDLPEGPAEAPVYGKRRRTSHTSLTPPAVRTKPLSRDNGVGSWSRVPSEPIGSDGAATSLRCVILDGGVRAVGEDVCEVLLDFHTPGASAVLGSRVAQQKVLLFTDPEARRPHGAVKLSRSAH